MSRRLLVVLACFLFLSEIGLAKIEWLGKTHVKIINDLRNGAALKFHCRSKDDDLGLQTLAQNQWWEFSFRPLALGLSPRTLFYCDFWWPGQSHHFVIYKTTRDDTRCGNPYCTWKIRPEGPCLQSKQQHICEEWAT